MPRVLLSRRHLGCSRRAVLADADFAAEVFRARRGDAERFDRRRPRLGRNVVAALRANWWWWNWRSPWCCWWAPGCWARASIGCCMWISDFQPDHLATLQVGASGRSVFKGCAGDRACSTRSQRRLAALPGVTVGGIGEHVAAERQLAIPTGSGLRAALRRTNTTR